MDTIGASDIQCNSCSCSQDQKGNLENSNMHVTCTAKERLKKDSDENYDDRSDQNAYCETVPNEVARPQAAGNAIDDGSESEGNEKTDGTPENIKKIDDIISPKETSSVDGSREDSLGKQSLAFTIDFGDGECSSSSATAVKYKNMVEKFQNRHKRGQSLSKVEVGKNSPTTSTGSQISLVSQSGGQSRKSEQGDRSPRDPEANKVRMRPRDRSTSAVRDANKRHSWSPRSSTCDGDKTQKVVEKQVNPSPSTKNNTRATPMRERKLKSVSDEVAETPVPELVKKIKELASVDRKALDSDNTSYRKTAFTPRSTAMQIALKKIEFVCPEPPLDDFRLEKGHNENDCESVSEAGTYTVDGDNYTEEQKELMNIDKTSCADFDTNSSDYNRPHEVEHQRPTDLPLLTSSENRLRSNILEISYYHDCTNLKPKVSYLEKIKSRVRSITKSPDKKDSGHKDVGTFTSVTTSGVLSKKPTLDSNPKLDQRNSLTKALVDSSEYVGGENNSKLIYPRPTYPSTFTDHQKVEYKLKALGCQAVSHTSKTMDFGKEDVPVLPSSPVSTEFSDVVISETGLKTAQSKNDWIQEWARNARRNTANCTERGQMSRSYDFDTMMYGDKPLDRTRKSATADYEYSSDTNVSKLTNCIIPISSRSSENNPRSPAGEYNNSRNNPTMFAKPPLSPSRIPSPMHSIGRARSTGRARGSLQDLSMHTHADGYSPETNVYLEKTATAISNLAQSLSRKNSLNSKSPTSNSNSPRHLNQRLYNYVADEISPTQAYMDINDRHHHAVHKRNLSFDFQNNLMSQSLTAEGRYILPEYRDRQRHNSFDAVLASPKRVMRGGYAGQVVTKPEQNSPIRRSSSFSVKSMGLCSNNTGIPVASGVNNRDVRKSIQPKTYSSTKTQIQKSASSTSFKKMYNDYDQNAEYYINDEDDLSNEFFSSDEDLNDVDKLSGGGGPITNTRCNKALFMRMEKNRQRMVGGNTYEAMPPNKVAGGVMACPNTPEMPRRVVKSAGRSSMRQSVPRDSSLNRLRGEVPNSLASAKKQLLQAATSPTTVSKSVQPKYMDISKYKPAQGANFLRKDQSKSTLVGRPEIRRSSSNASVTLNRNDVTRTSNHSVKSAGGKTGSNKRDISASKQKEAELEMWRRRATYDPLKAAAEGRKKQGEAKKLAQAKSNERHS